MTDLERQEDPREASPPKATPQLPDTFAIWFWRLVQLTGWGGFLHELIVGGASERPYILMACMAMMLGGAGLNYILRWIARTR